MLRVTNTVLSLGLNLLIERLRALPKRYKYLLLTIIILNEIRGLWVVYEIGGVLLP